MPKFPQPSTKYHHIVNVVLSAPLGSNPDLLAAEVRKRDPRGVYEPVRICEDMSRMIDQRGVFGPRNVSLTDPEIVHVQRLRSDMKRRSVWLTRSRVL